MDLSSGVSFKNFIGGGTSGVIGIMNTLVEILITISFGIFIWGVVNYFFINGGNENERAHGRQFIFWGIIGMVVLFSVWGIVDILLSTFGIAP